MKMGPITIGFGVALVALGLGFFAITQSPTALIPSGFGVVLGILGFLAGKESLKMHVMHAAVLIGLIGFGMTGYMSIKAVVTNNLDRPAAVAEQAIMAVICAAFVGLCVKSFIDARKARKQEEAATGQEAPQAS